MSTRKQQQEAFDIEQQIANLKSLETVQDQCH